MAPIDQVISEIQGSRMLLPILMTTAIPIANKNRKGSVHEPEKSIRITSSSTSARAKIQTGTPCWLGLSRE